MRKITIPKKVERTDQQRSSASAEATPRPRLGLRYGANMEPRSRP